MKKVIFTLFAVFALTTACGESIKLTPKDCGPLARGEYGVVFKTASANSNVTYFTKGKASDICSKLLSGNVITGYTKKLPKNSRLFTESEITNIKEFIVESYGNK